MTARIWTTFCGCVLWACQERPSPTAAGPSASVPSTTVEMARANPATESYPPDLNLPDLTQRLDCKKGKAKRACEIVTEFAKAERFQGNTPSGESRWLGRAYQIDNGLERSEFLLLQCHGVPTAKVGPSSLPLMISTSPLPIEVQVEARRMWTSLSHVRHRANRRNLAFKFIENYEPHDEREAINTTGTSVQLLGTPAEDLVYLRQPELKRLLWVQPSRQLHSKPGDGTYAEFWQATW